MRDVRQTNFQVFFTHTLLKLKQISLQKSWLCLPPVGMSFYQWVNHRPVAFLDTEKDLLLVLRWILLHASQDLWLKTCIRRKCLKTKFCILVQHNTSSLQIRICKLQNMLKNIFSFPFSLPFITLT